MQRSQRCRLVLALVVVCSVALPVHAGRAAAAIARSRMPASGEVAIRFANFLSPHEIKLVQQRILPAYHEAYPRVTVAFEPLPDDRIKAVTQIAAGTAADVFNLGDGDVSWFAAKGAVVDVVPLAARSHFSLSQYLPGTLIFGHLGSHQFALPKDYSPLAMYYNKDMFKAAGLPYPSGAWTWDDFRRDALKLTRNGVYGALLPGTWVRAAGAVVRSLGGRLDSADGKQVQGYMDSPATVKAVQFWIDLFTKDKVSPMPSQSLGDPFATGHAAMSLTGIWPSLGEAGYKKTLTFHWGVAPLPRGQMRANAICWAGFLLSSSSRHRKEAWGLISYLSGPVGDRVWATNGLPSVRSVAEQTAAWRDRVARVFLQEASFATLPEDANGPATAIGVGNTLTEGLMLLLTKPGLSVAQVLKSEAKKGQDAIDAYYRG